MNKIITQFHQQLLSATLALTMGFMAQVAGADDVPTVYLGNTNVVDLGLDQSALRVFVSHPGFRSGVCTVDIIANPYGRHNPIVNLFEDLSVEGLYPHSRSVVDRLRILSETHVRFLLHLEYLYGDGFVLRTKDHTKTLKEVIAETLGEHSKVVIMPRACASYDVL